MAIYSQNMQLIVSYRYSCVLTVTLQSSSFTRLFQRNSGALSENRVQAVYLYHIIPSFTTSINPLTPNDL
jgi:hypothetical protein